MTKERVEATNALADKMNIVAARIDEAYRALANIPHHINCKSLASPGCFEGDEIQGPCLQIVQRRRVRFLERKHAALMKKWRAA